MSLLDCENKEIRVGDRVVFTEGAKGLWPASVFIGKVTKLTPMSVKIDYTYHADSSYAAAAVRSTLKTASYVYVIR